MRIVSAFFAAAALFLAGCAPLDTAKVVEHQARAKASAAKWQAKAEIEKWKAVQELARSNSDVGRAMAGSAVQADAIKSAAAGGGGGQRSGGDGYQLPPDAWDRAVAVSREARGWLGLKFGRDVQLEGLRTQRDMRADDNATILGFGREIGFTGRFGIDAAESLGGSAIDKIPSLPPE